MVISGHGNYATGMKSALEFLAGKNQDMYYVDFSEGQTEETLRNGLTEIIEDNPDAEFLFVCDLLGGTPFKMSAEICNTMEKAELVAGCNISGILQMILTKENYTLEDLADEMIEVSKNSTLRFNKFDVNSGTPMHSIDEDGI